jgi:hypothetical protein
LFFTASTDAPDGSFRRIDLDCAGR